MAEQTNVTQDEQIKTAPDEGATGTAPEIAGKSFSQADVDRIVQERLERERKKADAVAQKAREDAEAEAARKNGEWQKLAEQAQSKVVDMEKRMSEIDTLRADLTRYQDALKANLEAQRKGMPEHIISLLDNLDPVKQLEYIAANREKLMSTSQVDAEKRPLGASPKPADGGKPLTPEELIARKAVSPFYRQL